MRKKNTQSWLFAVTAVIILISLILKLAIIFTYGNRLSLDSDDLNYIKSAKVLLETGRFVFHEYNEPTVFIMPLYPVFLAGVFGAFGTGFAGLQAARVIQALVGTASLYLIFLIARRLFGNKTALLSVIIAAFYMPNLVTPGYMLTESLFTLLLLLLLNLSFIFAENTNPGILISIGVIYTLASLCRPTIAPYPAILAVYLLFFKKHRFLKVIKSMSVIAVIFILIMSPWWIRNYREYGVFIPLAASGGNPMLQGTYINYRQTSENVVHYKIGKNAFETNKTETRIALERIRTGFSENFGKYLKWYTIDKTKFFWLTVFYWKKFAGVNTNTVIINHYSIFFTGFIGFMILALKKHRESALPFMILIYFNIAHCVYMAFDRYAYPVVNILMIFSAHFLILLLRSVKSSLLTFKSL